MAAVDGIPANYVDDFVVLVGSRAEGTAPCWHIVEQILDSDLGAVPSSHWLGLWGLPGLGGLELSPAVISTPGTGRVLGLGGDRKMGYVADTCQCLPAEPICCNGGQVLEFLQLGGGESLTQDRQVFFLSIGQTPAQLSQ